MAFVPSSFVAMDDAFVDHRIDDRARDLQISRGFVLVARFYGVGDALDSGAQFRAERHVMGAALDGLTGSLFS